nr:hypothetical protein [Tanacetum cinerariifolium]
LTRYLKGHPKLELWYPKESPFDLVAYSDSDYGGASQDHKSTTRGCQFLAASCCGRVLWIQNQLLDYGHHFIRDCFEKNLISMDHIHTDENVVDLLTKPFDAGRFQYLVVIGTSKYWGVLRILMISLRLIPLVSKDSEQRTHEFIHVYLASASVYVWIGHYTRRARIAQSLALPPVADEPTSPIGDDSQGEACPTDFGLAADQYRANIAKTSTLPIDSTPRVTSFAADKGSMQQKLDELTALCISMQRQQSEMVSRVTKQSGDDALIKGRRLDEGEEAAERVSDDTEEMATVLTSMDASSILTSGGVQGVPIAAEVPTATVSIPTGSGVVSTASSTIPTAASIFTTATDSIHYTRRKGKEKMIARDAEIARIHAEEELQMLIDGLDRNNKNTQQRKPLSRKQQKEFYMSMLKSHAGWKAKHFKGMKLEEIKEKFDPVWKQFQDFIPLGSKEEAERYKRKGLRLEQESVKKLKTSEEVKETEEVLEEKVKEMMQLVPVEEIYVEALQVKHPIVDWKVVDPFHFGTSKNATNPPPVPPTPQSPHTFSIIKLHILKKGSTASSSSTQNVAFVSSDSTNSTNEVSTAYGVFTSFGHNSQKECSSSYTDDLMYSLFSNQYKEYISKGNQESRRRDARNTGYKARDNGKRPATQDEHKAMVTINGEGSDTEVTSCSKECENTYAKLKKLYDEQREQFGVASIEI